MFIPDPDLDFLPIPDPGVKKARDPGSGSATLRFAITRFFSCITGRTFFRLLSSLFKIDDDDVCFQHKLLMRNIRLNYYN
jgi:hypothetical protein